MKFDVRYSSHPDDAKHYTTEENYEHFKIEKVFIEDEINLVYSHYDRIIAGGAMPVSKGLKLEGGEFLHSAFFLELREMGVINVGGAGYIVVEGTKYPMNYQDGMYIGRGNKNVEFYSVDALNPAKFYINSSPAHKEYPLAYIPLEKANHVHLGDKKNLNVRTINQYVHPAVCKSCQLVMGMTILEEGSVWNTMPCHTHNRRMEVYFYFNLKPDDFVVHLMGEPNETRHIIMRNEEAVISPSYSIHSGVGTSPYIFIWGMCGENQTFNDMDNVDNKDLR